MRKLILAIITITLCSCSIGVNPKKQLCTAFPDYEALITEYFTDKDAKLFYQAYTQNKNQTLPDIINDTILNSKNTPIEIANSIEYLNDNEYSLKCQLFMRIPDEKNKALIRYNVYSYSKLSDFTIAYIYNDSTGVFDTVRVELDNDDITDNNSYSFMFLCLFVMCSIDNTFDNDISTASDILYGSFDSELNYNGFSYRMNETDTSTAFCITKQ